MRLASVSKLNRRMGARSAGARICPPRRGGPTSPSQALCLHALLRKQAGSGDPSGRAPPERANVRRGAADPPPPVKLSVCTHCSENRLEAGTQVGALRRSAHLSAAARRTHLPQSSSLFARTAPKTGWKRGPKWARSAGARKCPPRRGGPTSPSQALCLHILLRKQAGSGDSSGRGPPERAFVRRGAADPPPPVKLSVCTHCSENRLEAGTQVGALRRSAQMSAAARRTHLAFTGDPQPPCLQSGQEIWNGQSSVPR